MITESRKFGTFEPGLEIQFFRRSTISSQRATNPTRQLRKEVSRARRCSSKDLPFLYISCHVTRRTASYKWFNFLIQTANHSVRRDEHTDETTTRDNQREGRDVYYKQPSWRRERSKLPPVTLFSWPSLVDDEQILFNRDVANRGSSLSSGGLTRGRVFPTVESIW